ncbi:Uncharacterised protein [Nocardia otitidiscaviarum]|uniref:Uncharacterized protein n=1 Tax=Nocardia otitidiscaviarum TaxID=1823 RepID=A0A378YKI3_9NOCA|nr:Uncharacterised protein [Nocardia otitidiscaviarum]
MLIGKGGSEVTGCPSLYLTDHGYLAQGWKTSCPETVEIPHLLLGFLKPDTYIDATLTDTGRGTFTLTGRPVVDGSTASSRANPRSSTTTRLPGLVSSRT